MPAQNNLSYSSNAYMVRTDASLGGVNIPPLIYISPPPSAASAGCVSFYHARGFPPKPTNAASFLSASPSSLYLPRS
jgi:hypothetical protein